MKATTVPAFDNIGSRKRLTTTSDEFDRIQQRIGRLDRRLVAELRERIASVDGALLHLRQHVDLVASVERLRRRR